MKVNMRIVLIAIFSLILIGIGSAFSQEAGKAEVNPAVPEEAAFEPETQWIWGEVISIDAAKGQAIVKYLDYENDIEKEITITVNEKTAYENLVSLDQLKPKDTVSIDYTVTSDEINIAKNISMEKPEETQGTVAVQKEEPAVIGSSTGPIESTPSPSTEVEQSQETQTKVPVTEESQDIKQ